MPGHQLGQRLHRDRRVGVHVPVSRLVRRARGVDELLQVAELGHEAVNRRSPPHAADSSSSFASGSMVRISKIEIIGRERMKRENNARKNPMLSTYVAPSPPRPAS